MTASTSQASPANVPAYGNNGDVTTRWCASDQTMPQWWQVDLAAVHALRSFSVQFQHPDRTYTYHVETSQDGAVYVNQTGDLTGMGAVLGANFVAGVTGRYVRITVTYGAPFVDATGTHNTWATFYEFSVLGT